MIINNKTGLTDAIVHEQVAKNRNRLYRSKSGSLQITLPSGYLTLLLDINTNGEVIITATFERMQSWKLD